MKTLVVQIAALGCDTAVSHAEILGSIGLRFRPMESCFPALTCPAQAVFRTAAAPGQTSVISNGRFDPITRKTDFWNQSSALVRGPRIWERLQEQGKTVGVLFWQQSLGEDAEVILSPAPIHKHHGGMIQDCYSMPQDLYGSLSRSIGTPFPLHRYWGPLAGIKSSTWIGQATARVMGSKHAPDLLLTYLPHLDYSLQKYGTRDTKRVGKAVQDLSDVLSHLLEVADVQGYRVLVWGDYAIHDVDRAVPLNLALRRAGLFRTRTIKGMIYPDLYTSRAFAMVDHQVALICARDASSLREATALVSQQPGVDEVNTIVKVNNNGAPVEQVVATACSNSWFSYPWWDTPREAPDYARHVDIHNKIGYDPCELFFGWPPPAVSLNTDRVKGSHGRTDQPACFAATWDITPDQPTLQGLSAKLADELG